MFGEKIHIIFYVTETIQPAIKIPTAFLNEDSGENQEDDVSIPFLMIIILADHGAQIVQIPEILVVI